MARTLTRGSLHAGVVKLQSKYGILLRNEPNEPPLKSYGGIGGGMRSRAKDEGLMTSAKAILERAEGLLEKLAPWLAALIAVESSFVILRWFYRGPVPPVFAQFEAILREGSAVGTLLFLLHWLRSFQEARWNAMILYALMLVGCGAFYFLEASAQTGRELIETRAQMIEKGECVPASPLIYVGGMECPGDQSPSSIFRRKPAYAPLDLQ